MPNGTAASSLSLSRSRSKSSRKGGSPAQSKADLLVSPTSGNLSSLPSRVIRKFTYSDYWNLAPGGAVASLQAFRMNSLFDPDISGVGGTPSGFAQWCGANAPYQYYRVHAAKCRVTFINTWNAPILAGIMFTPVTGIVPSSGPTAQQALTENPNCTGTLINAYHEYKSVSTVERSDTVSHVVGRDVSRDNDYASQYNNNPVVCPVITMVVAPADGATANLTCSALVTIEYTAELSMANPGIVD